MDETADRRGERMGRPWQMDRPGVVSLVLLMLMLVAAGCGGGGAGADPTAACQSICMMQASCSGVSSTNCQSACVQQAGVLDPSAWMDIQQCFRQDPCGTGGPGPDAAGSDGGSSSSSSGGGALLGCVQQVAAASSGTTVNDFENAICAVVARCSTTTAAQCRTMLDQMFMTSDSGNPLAVLNLLSNSIKSCLLDCVQNLSCDAAMQGGQQCIGQCNVPVSSIYGDPCQHSDCPANSTCMLGSMSLTCDCNDGFHQVSSDSFGDFTCETNCTAGSCGAMGQCGTEGGCICSEGAYLASDQTCHRQVLFTDVAAGGEYLCGVRDDGKVECKGASDPDSRSVVSSGADYKQVVVIDEPALFAAAALHTDGQRDYWQNIDNPLDPQPPNPNLVFTQLSAGNSACGVLMDGSLWCDQIDLGVIDPSALPFDAVYVGDTRVCATKQGVATCWGDNNAIPDPNSGWMKLALGTSGSLNSCGLKTDGSVSCWQHGNASPADGPMDPGPFTDLAVSDDVSCALKTDHTVVCWGNDIGNATTPADAPGYMALTAASDKVCGLGTDGIIRCWGFSTQYIFMSKHD
jgi:hypothetical protein